MEKKKLTAEQRALLALIQRSPKTANGFAPCAERFRDFVDAMPSDLVDSKEENNIYYARVTKLGESLLAYI
jgi:hypothetical protein